MDCLHTTTASEFLASRNYTFEDRCKSLSRLDFAWNVKPSLNLCLQESPLSLLPSPRGLRGRLAGQPSAEVSSSHHHHHHHFQYQDVYTTSRYLGLIFVNNCPHNHTPPPPRNHHHHHRLQDHHLNLQNQDVFTTSPQRRLQIVLSKVQVKAPCICIALQDLTWL